MPIETIEIKKSGLYEFLKRFMDIILSAILIIFFSPLMLVSAVAIKLDSEGPVFADVPERVGKNGKLFKMYKFRSMVENAHEILRENPKFSNLYDKYKRQL